MEFHASGKLWRRTPIAYTTPAKRSGGKSLKWKAAEWFLASLFTNNTLLLWAFFTFKIQILLTIRKSDVFTCEMLNPNHQTMEWVIAWKTTHTFLEHFSQRVIVLWTCRRYPGNYSKCGSFFLNKTIEIYDKNYSSFCIYMLWRWQKSTKTLNVIF